MSWRDPSGNAFSYSRKRQIMWKLSFKL